VLRSFNIADISLLNATKNRAVFLNNETYLTDGSGGLTRSAILSPLSSFTGTFTFVSTSNGGQPLLGQLHHEAEDALAYCRFLAPEDGLSSAPQMLEHMLVCVGERGAQSLVIEVEEGSDAFSVLRKAGFSIYARQRVWRLDKAPNAPQANSLWRPMLSRDQLAMQLLRNRLLPGEVQQIETDVDKSKDGYVYYRDGELLAFAEVRRGRHGIWLQPFVDLNAEPFDEILFDLLAKLHPRASRPLYICLRSYQNWLEGALIDLEAQPSPRQAVLVRRTVVPFRVEETRRVPVTEARAEPTASIRLSSRRTSRTLEWATLEGKSYDQTPNYR
jgi:hypothetical protein